ncbi:MAG: 3-deoxy-D-manno-octulosonic acid transferase, partial [Deltaproteobacteria bacterium]
VLSHRDGLVIVAGSTHPGEEEIVLDAYAGVLSAGTTPRLIIAVRHLERIPSIEKLIRQKGFKPVRLSTYQGTLASDGAVFILDTLGELRYFYSVADICFVGGSFAECGGHNILEPVYFSKPTLFGPHMENFRDVEELVLGHRCGVKVRTPAELAAELRKLVHDEGYRQQLARRCPMVFREERKSVEEQMEMITRCLLK